jgi:hypothetical protein
MVSILEGELAEIIGAALVDAELTLDMTVTRSTPGGGPPFDPDPPTVTEYPCKGFVDTFSDAYLAGGLVQAGDLKIVIVATSLAVEPRPGDSVFVRGKTYSVIAVGADPAKALYELQGRA